MTDKTFFAICDYCGWQSADIGSEIMMGYTIPKTSGVYERPILWTMYLDYDSLVSDFMFWSKTFGMKEYADFLEEKSRSCGDDTPREYFDKAARKIRDAYTRTAWLIDENSNLDSFEQKIADALEKESLYMFVEPKQMTDVYVFGDGNARVWAYVEKPIQEGEDGETEYFYPEDAVRARVFVDAIMMDIYEIDADEKRCGMARRICEVIQKLFV